MTSWHFMAISCYTSPISFNDNLIMMFPMTSPFSRIERPDIEPCWMLAAQVFQFLALTNERQGLEEAHAAAFFATATWKYSVLKHRKGKIKQRTSSIYNRMIIWHTVQIPHLVGESKTNKSTTTLSLGSQTFTCNCTQKMASNYAYIDATWQVHAPSKIS